MYGQLKSRLTCYKCQSVSNTFDPFLALSVPIPRATSMNVKVVYYPLVITETDRIREIIIEAQFKHKVSDVMAEVLK